MAKRNEASVRAPTSSICVPQCSWSITEHWTRTRTPDCPSRRSHSGQASYRKSHHDTLYVRRVVLYLFHSSHIRISRDVDFTCVMRRSARVMRPFHVEISFSNILSSQRILLFTRSTKHPEGDPPLSPPSIICYKLTSRSHPSRIPSMRVHLTTSPIPRYTTAPSRTRTASRS